LSVAAVNVSLYMQPVPESMFPFMVQTTSSRYL